MKKVKTKARAKGSIGSGGARQSKAPDGEFSLEGKLENHELRDKKRKLNEGRTHEFKIDPAGHYILLSYKPTTGRFSKRSRVAVFDSNLPDPGSFELKTIRRLYDAASALESGAVGPKLRLWLADALQRLADQANRTEPNWDARTPFGTPPATPGLPGNAAWTQPFVALDVEFGRAAGQSTAGAAAATGKAWSQDYDVVEKAHEKWSKVCRRIVLTITREDGVDGISPADSAADHQAGLRLIWEQRTRGAAAHRMKKRKS
jgi:hypothetical protein